MHLILLSLKSEAGKTSDLIWIKLHKCPCEVYHVYECYIQLYNLAQGHNTDISQENQNNPPLPLKIHICVQLIQFLLDFYFTAPQKEVGG